MGETESFLSNLRRHTEFPESRFRRLPNGIFEMYFLINSDTAKTLWNERFQDYYSHTLSSESTYIFRSEDDNGLHEYNFVFLGYHRVNVYINNPTSTSKTSV